MKPSFITTLSLLFVPVISSAAWNNTINYNPISGTSYHNKELHLYDNKHTDHLCLTGRSFLTLNGSSFLSNSMAKNKSNIHLYIADNNTLGIPAIYNTAINDRSILTMERNTASTGSLFIDKNARLNITHVDEDSNNPFFSPPEVAGNVYIENLHLAGRAFISPSSILADEYEESDYQQPPGMAVITNIKKLVMQPGSLLRLQEYIPRMQFNELHINDLSGSGTFILGSHLAAGLSDRLTVWDNASGNFDLWVADSGYEPLIPQAVNLITTHHGDAHFSLQNKNGVVEAGVWQYTLQYDEIDDSRYWYLSGGPQHIVADNETQPDNSAASSVSSASVTDTQGTSRVSPSVRLARYNNPLPAISRSAQAVMNMASTARHILATEMSTFHQRMNDASPDKGNLSLWVRHLKNHSSHTTHHGTSFDTHLQGIQLGMDNSAEFNHGRWLLGAFISDSKTTVRSGRINNGNIRSQSGALYTTWLDNSGFYWDNVLKLNHFRHAVRTEMNSGQIAQGHYRQRGFSIASETGYPLHSGKNMTLTPYGKVSYFRTGKAKHVLDNGLATTLYPASNLDGEAGLLLEVPFSVADRRIRPYFKVAVSHEFTGDNSLSINSTTLKLPDARTQGKYGLGGRVYIADNFSVYAAMDYQKGSKIKSPVDVSFGLRVSF